MAHRTASNRSLILALLSAVASACVDIVRFELPSADGYGAGILAVEHADGLEVRAFALGSPVDHSLVFNPGETTVVSALYYREHLASLGLADGLIEPAEKGASARQLPAAAAIYQRSVGREDDAWLEVEEPREPIRAFEIPSVLEPCSPFEANTQIVAVSDKTDLLVPLDDSTALMASMSGELRVLTPETTSPPFDSNALIAHGNALLGDGKVLIVDADEGALRQLVVDSPRTAPAISMTTLAPAIASSRNSIRLAASPPGSPFELFMLTAEGVIHRWTTGAPAWSVTGRVELGGAECAPLRLSWAGEGEVAVTRCWPGFLRVKTSGEVLEEVPPDPAGDRWRVTAARAIGGFGVVVAVVTPEARYAFFHFDPEAHAWSAPTFLAADGSDDASQFDVIGPYRRGFYATGIDLGVFAFDRATGFCPVFAISPDSITEVGDFILFLSPLIPFSSSSIKVHWFRPTGG